jgi:DNA-binding SARP family transcriptional activator
MEFRILGPLEVRDERGAVALGGIKPRAVLTKLLLHANEPVSAERLALALWGVNAPAGAIRTVRVHVSRLRKALGDPEILTTTPAGYRLRVLPGELDADRFARLAEEGYRALADDRAEHAAAVLREALQVSRGPPLADLAFEAFAQAEIARLEEQQLAALEARIEADLAQHRHAGLVGELRQLVSINPTRERLVGQLMLALYRCGRQADALEVYQRARTRLDAELGLEPGPALKAMQVQILEQSSLLDPAPRRAVEREEGGAIALPAVLRSPPATPYVGRIDEREVLRRLVEDAHAGSRRIAFVGGEPGIGKTRLAALTALDAHAAGFAVSWGASAEDLGAPYGTWIGVLSHLIEHAREAVLAAHVARHGGAVTRIVRSLDERVRGASPEQQSDPEIERYLLFAAVADLLEALCAVGPLALVLDDLQWADPQSLALLHHVAAASAHLPLLIVVTYRDSDLGAGHPLTGMLADLHRLDGIERISLGGLDIAEIADMMAAGARQDIGSGGRRLATQIAAETGGNPFFVDQILHHLQESGAIRCDGDGCWCISDPVVDLGLPQSVREVVGRRVRRLGEPAQAILTIAAVLGTTFDIELLERLVDAGEDQLLVALEAATAGSVLVESSEVVGRFTFAHALINHSLYASLSATRRARMHCRVAEALEDLAGADPERRLAELAHHWSMTRDRAHGTKAAHYARLAGERALDQLAPDDAIRWFSTGLEQLAGRPDDTERCDLLIGLGVAKRQLGDVSFRDALIDASAIAETVGDHARLTRAVLANTLGPYGAPGPCDEQRVDILERALELLPADWPYRPRITAILGKELYYGGDAVRATRLSEEALALARAEDDARELARVMAFTTAYSSVTALEQHGARVQELAQLADEIDDPELRFQAANARFIHAMYSGEPERLDAALELMVALAKAIGQPVLRWTALWAQSARHTLAGDLTAGETLTLQAAAIAREHRRPGALLITFGQLMSIRGEQDRLEELVEPLEQEVAQNPDLRLLQLTRGFIDAETGRLDRAAAILAGVAAEGFSFPFDRTRAFNLARCADIAIRVQAHAAAAQIHERLLPYRAQFATPAGISSRGSVELSLGRLASLLGRGDDADQHFTAAQRAHEHLGAPLLQARTSLAMGQSLLEHGAPEDLPDAMHLLRSALTLARTHGSAATEREAQALLTRQLASAMD